MYSLMVGKGWVLPFIVIELLHQETCADLGSCALPDLALVAALCSYWEAWSVLGAVLRLYVECTAFVDCRLWFVVFRLCTWSADFRLSCEPGDCSCSGVHVFLGN